MAAMGPASVSGLISLPGVQQRSSERPHSTRRGHCSLVFFWGGVWCQKYVQMFGLLGAAPTGEPIHPHTYTSTYTHSMSSASANTASLSQAAMSCDGAGASTTALSSGLAAAAARAAAAVVVVSVVSFGGELVGVRKCMHHLYLYT